MLVNHLFESNYGAKAGVETIKQLLHAVKDSKDIDLKVGPEMFPIEYGDARYLLSFFKANRHLGDSIAEKFGDANWIEQKLAKRDAIQSPDRLNKFDSERMKDVQKNKVLDLEEDYKGWSYSTYDEDYGDVMKTSHVATKDGKEVSIDWSPYNRMSDEEFKTWIDLGMPTRKDVNSIGPLSPEDLAQLMKTKLGTKARLTQEEAKKEDDVTKKMTGKQKIALQKAMMRNKAVTKGDPVAAMAMSLEKDVDRLDKENDKEEADIAAQALVDKFHTQELDALKKMLDNLIRK